MDLFDPKTWANYDAAGLIAERLEAVKRVIPGGVKTILDAGCGNGAISNALADKYEVTGLDISPAALEHVTTTKVLASVTDIPFADRSFDLCMCNEVLEHLDRVQMEQALAELKRCARRYIIVSVPYREQLERGLIKCKSCGNVFHVYGHQQSFDLKRLDALIQCDRLHHELLGPRVHRFNPALLSFRQKLLGQWHKPSVPINCLACQGTDFRVKRSILSKAVNALGRITFSSSRAWLLALYSVSGHAVPQPKSQAGQR